MLRETCPQCGGWLDDGIPCAPPSPPRTRGQNLHGESHATQTRDRLARNRAWRALPWWRTCWWNLARAMGLTRHG